MGTKRRSYRNPFFSAFICALLYFIISNLLYWYFNGNLPFTPFAYFDWFQNAVGTLAMGFLVLIVEFVRNLLGKGVDSAS